MKITPQEIHHKEFKHAMRGYSVEDVDIFLDEVADTMERLTKENYELRETVEQHKERLQKFEDMSGALQETLITAQRTADEMKARALEEAQRTLDESKSAAERQLSDSAQEAKRLEAELERLHKLYVDFKKEIKRSIIHFADAIDQAEPSSISAVESIAAPRTSDPGEPPLTENVVIAETVSLATIAEAPVIPVSTEMSFASGVPLSPETASEKYQDPVQASESVPTVEPAPAMEAVPSVEPAPAMEIVQPVQQAPVYNEYRPAFEPNNFYTPGEPSIPAQETSERSAYAEPAALSTDDHRPADTSEPVTYSPPPAAPSTPTWSSSPAVSDQPAVEKTAEIPIGNPFYQTPVQHSHVSDETSPIFSHQIASEHLDRSIEAEKIGSTRHVDEPQERNSMSYSSDPTSTTPSEMERSESVSSAQEPKEKQDEIGEPASKNDSPGLSFGDRFKDPYR